MDRTDYMRGFQNALELALAEIERARDLEDTRKRIRTLWSLAVEHKLDEIQRQLGCISTDCRWRGHSQRSPSSRDSHFIILQAAAPRPYKTSRPHARHDRGDSLVKLLLVSSP